MKFGFFVALALAIIFAQGESDAAEWTSNDDVEKRDIRDTIRDLLSGAKSLGRDAISDFVDLASDAWDTLRDKIRDYDVDGRLGTLRDKIKDRFGDHIDKINDIKFDDIAKAAKGVIQDARVALRVDDVVDKIRAVLGDELDDVDDNDIADIVAVIEDDLNFNATNPGDK